MPGVLIKEI